MFVLSFGELTGYNDLPLFVILLFSSLSRSVHAVFRAPRNQPRQYQSKTATILYLEPCPPPPPLSFPTPPRNATHHSKTHPSTNRSPSFCPKSWGTSASCSRSTANWGPCWRRVEPRMEKPPR